MRFFRPTLSRALALTSIAAAGLLSACSGNGEPVRLAAPSAPNADVVSNPPTLAFIAPSTGPTQGGYTVTLSGTNLGASTIVTVGSQSAAIEPGATATQVTFRMPAGQGVMPVSATTSAGVSNQLPFTYSGPVITAITPASVPSSGGTNITITGSSFGLTPTVTIGGVIAPLAPQAQSHTSLVVTAPQGAPGSQADVRVTVLGQVSNGAMLSYDPPSIVNISPSHGSTAGGTMVTLSGASLGASPTVLFNGQPQPTTVLAPHTQVSFAVPAGEGLNAQVSVRSGTATSNTMAFNYDRPSIATIVPASGPTNGGTTITIMGNNFGVTPTVTIGGTRATVSAPTHTSVVAVTPAGVAGPSPVVVTAAGQSSDPAFFNYIAPAPRIVSMSPTTGPTAGGTSVTLVGTGFASTHSVNVGGTIVATTTTSETQLSFAMPAGEGTVPVSLATNGGQSNALNFTYGAPSIASLSPASGSAAGGYTITIVGANFGVHPTVTLDGSPIALTTPTSHTQIAFTAPAGTPGHDALVRVSVAGQASNGASFHYNAPSLANISPAHGPTAGGNSITLTGTGFGASPSVSFGGTSTTILDASETRIVVAAPAGQGSASVVVTSGGVQSGALTYSYDAPVIASLTPTSGPVAGSTRVTITGSNFGLTPLVTFGGVSAVLIDRSHSQLVVSTPPGAPVSVPVIVTVAGKVSNGASYQYLCPAGTVIANNSCVTPVVLLHDVVATLPSDAQTSLAPLAADIASKLADTNSHNNAGVCGQLNAMSRQTLALARNGTISAGDADAVQRAVALLTTSTGCR